MQQKTLIALGALGVIAVLAFFTMRAPDKGERVGPKERPIAALKAADVKELEVTSNGGKEHVVIKLEGGSWKITAPGNYAADQQSVKTAVEQLEKVQFGDLVTEKKEKFGDLELSDEKGVHVVGKDSAGKALFDGWIGKSVSGFTMVRPGGAAAKGQVWQSTGIFKYAFAKDIKTWRDHAVFDFKAEDVSKLAVEAGGQKLVLEKIANAKPSDAKDKPAPPGEAHWKVAETTVKVDPLDDSVANQLVQTLSSLRAADFDDASKPAEVGLATPRFKITATVKGAPITLLVGNAKGEDVWLGVDGRSQVYLFRKNMIERITQKPADFRDKTVLKAKAEDIVGIDFVHGGESLSIERPGDAWKAAKGAKIEVDEAKVKPVVSSFEDVKGSTFADASVLAVSGMTKPAGSVTLHLRDKSTETIKIGNENSEKTEYFVQKVGSPDVVLMKKFMVDRFWKRPADLAKSPAAK